MDSQNISVDYSHENHYKIILRYDIDVYFMNQKPHCGE
jgi:hypothetical protein